MAAGVALTVALLAGCSSTSPTARQLAANVTSTSAAPTTTAVAKPPTLECPIHAPRVIPTHQLPGTVSTFVPGRPVALLACRYHGYNQPQPSGSLAGSAHFAPGPFVTALNTALPVPDRAYNCPMDAGERMLVIFAYDDGSRLTASIETMGCGFATNGDRSVVDPTATLEHLEAVLGHDHG